MNIELSFQTVMPLLFVSFCASTVQDHYFDVVTNVVGLVAAVLGDKYLWWIDPVGAVLLAVYTIVNWSKTVLENAGTSKARYAKFNELSETLIFEN
jgi:hypothetical protein